jgi:hypothetical protein
VSKVGIGKTEPADEFDFTEHFVINDEVVVKVNY